MAKERIRRRDDRTCCGVIEEAKYEAREKRANRTKPQPWIVLKLAVFLTLGIIGYASYVYIGRLCVPMLIKSDDAFGSQTTGIVFLVIFSLLLVMILWTYAKVVLTPPGFAKDYTSKSAQPTLPRPPRVRPASYDSESVDVAGMEYEPRATVELSRDPSQDHTRTEVSLIAPSQSRAPSRGTTDISEKQRSRRGSAARSPLVSSPNTGHRNRQLSQKSASAEVQNEPNAGILDALPQPNATNENRDLEAGQDLPGLPPPLLSRRPPTTPILQPEYRYCSRDEVIKPYRTHHCRACGTCVLKYDHHCPWVGQCVGARNQKFFVNFVFWAAIYCVWIFVTLIIMVAKAGSGPTNDIDIQEVVIIAIAGLFGFFTAALFASHLNLISLNQTTVEAVGFRAMKDKERWTLGQLHSWHEVGAKRRTKEQWDAEWGRIGREGNIWSVGSRRENWESVMGKNVWWWFLPIGRSASNGLTYPVNPRFDSEGRWRRRAEWPSELR